jgi:hypothetical protein
MAMSEVDRMFKQFIEQHQSGSSAEPLEYLSKLEGTDRAELAALIAGYLQRAPRREWDPEAFKGSAAERAVEAALAEPEGWPGLLKRLRDRARLRRDEVVARLAEALGVQSQQDKVALYYHRMERGQLEPAGVSSRVLEALSGILGESTDALRQTGAAMAAAEEGPTEVFARRTMPQPEVGALYETRAPDQALEAGAPAHPEWDEVDRLFLGGD